MKLTHRVLEVELARLRLGQNPARPRGHALELVEELADAIQITEWVEPLCVVELAPGLFEIVAGFKRHAALLQLVKRGELSMSQLVPVVVVPRGMEINTAENLHRTPLAPIPLLNAIERFTRRGWTQTRIARLIGRNKSQVCRYANIRTRLQPDVWAAIQDRSSLSLAELVELSRLDARRQRLRVGLSPLVGPPKPPPSKAGREKPRRVATLKTEIRRIERMPRSRDQQLVLKTLNWVLCRRQSPPI